MELTTNRLILREFNEHDWTEVLAYQYDLRYLCYYPWAGRMPEEVQMFVDQQVERLRTKF